MISLTQRTLNTFVTRTNCVLKMSGSVRRRHKSLNSPEKSKELVWATFVIVKLCLSCPFQTLELRWLLCVSSGIWLDESLRHLPHGKFQ